MAKKKEGVDYFILRETNPDDYQKLQEIFKQHPVVEVDIGKDYLEGAKNVVSDKVVFDNTTYWRCQSSVGIYWNTNHRDPKIINKVTGRPRGNIDWSGKGGNPSGKPKGAVNRRSALQMLNEKGVHPVEFYIALMMKDKATLRRYGIHEKDFKGITVAQQMKAGDTLIKKTTPDLKSADMDVNGDPKLSQEIQEADARSQIQVYLPQGNNGNMSIEVTPEQKAEIDAVGIDGFMKQHEEELVPYDKSNEDDSLVWEVKEE